MWKHTVFQSKTSCNNVDAKSDAPQQLRWLDEGVLRNTGSNDWGGHLRKDNDGDAFDTSEWHTFMTCKNGKKAVL